MLVIEPLKLIYIRVPKTGSTSFLSVLDPLEPRHMGSVHGNAREAIRVAGRRGSKIEGGIRYKWVGFIRHPYWWARSAHNHWRNNPDMFPYMKRPKTILGFVRCLRQTPMEWLSDENGELVCEPWRTEDMGEIMPALGLEEGHRNVKHTEPPDLDDETKDAIYKRFRREFDFGGYEP